MTGEALVLQVLDPDVMSQRRQAGVGCRRRVLNVATLSALVRDRASRALYEHTT